MEQYILSLDQGTTSSRCILFDRKGNICSMAQKEFPQIFPKPGWVEHDPGDIWNSQYEVMKEAMDKLCVSPEQIAGIGITNQRETTIVWNRNTGEPIYNAIVWQCRRTTGQIEQLKKDGLAEYVKRTTGLIPDPYFSASKIAWILEHVENAREQAEKGELLFGTVDTWLIWKLTNGKVHVTDDTNASRTMLFDIHKRQWDDRILEYFSIPKSILPKVCTSSEIYGYTDCQISGKKIPIAGIAGDQQAALFGQCCLESGEIKNTYGTGCFLLMHTGEKPIESKSGLLTTMAANYDGKARYALEGSVFVAGAAIQWLRDELGLIKNAAETEKYCEEVVDTAGVYVVPAFTGLGAPYWNASARGIITGLTRGVGKKHIIRATVESLAYQVFDLVAAMKKDAKLEVSAFKVDGGASVNNFLMQFQSNILNTEIYRPSCIETTALGAAYLAGLAVGYWDSIEDIKANWSLDKKFSSVMDEIKRGELLDGWNEAVKRCK